VTRSKFHTEDQLKLDVTVQNVISTATRRPGFGHPLYIGIRKHISR